MKYVDENVAKLLCLFQQSISPQVKRHKSYKENSTRKIQLKHTRKKIKKKLFFRQKVTKENENVNNDS